MKRQIILLFFLPLLLTGCGSWSTQNVNMDDPDYNYDEYIDCDCNCDSECREYDSDFFTKEAVWDAIYACEDYKKSGYKSLEECFLDFI